MSESSLDSDHLQIKATFNLNKRLVSNSIKQSKSKLNYNKANWDNLFKGLNQIKFKECNGANLNEISRDFTKKTMNVVEFNIPTTINNSGYDSSLPQHIIELIKEKNTFKNKYLKNGNIADRDKMYQFKIQIKEEIIKNKQNEMINFLEKLSKTPTATLPFWRKINKIRKKNKETGMPVLIRDNREFVTDEEKANLFSEKLTLTFSENDTEDFDSEFKEKLDNYINEKKYEDEYSDKTIKLFNLKELNKAIKDLNNKKSTDESGMSNYLIKKLPEEYKDNLLQLFNKCLSKNEIPSDWKTALVTMIPKKAANKKDPNNYRPISQTPCLAKLFEKLIYGRLEQHLDSNKIIINSQSGFRKNRSTKDNIFHLTQKVLESFNRKKKVCAIFFDIAAAFDKVWHNGLIYKLIQIKLPYYLILWFIEFLKNRKFKVKIGIFTTNECNIFTSVPQGCVNSPTLFSIYINDIPNNTSKNKTYTMLFADDKAYYYIYKKGDKTASLKINRHLQKIQVWLNKWRLKMAPHKCSYLVFSNGTRNESPNLDLKLNGTKLKYDNNPTFLGIRFDNHMTLKNQVSYLKETCIQRLNILKILAYKTWMLNLNTLTQIYYVLIRSVLEYSAILAPVLAVCNMNTLQVIQNNALRIIVKKPLITRTSILELHNSTKVEMLKIRFEKLRGRYVQKAIINNNPIITELCDEFKQFNSGGRVLQTTTLLCKMHEINII